MGNALEFVLIEGPSCDDVEKIRDNDGTDAGETVEEKTLPSGDHPQWTHRNVRELTQKYFKAECGESKCKVRRDIQIEDVVIFNSWIKIVYHPEEFGGGLLTQDIFPLMKELQPIAAFDWVQFGIASKDRTWLMTYLKKDESELIKKRILEVLPDFNLERDFYELDL